jgi:UDP-N-acetylmuramate dehydrogenase
MAIRGVKLPDPNKIANVGSFFKNPIVAREIAESLQKENPNLNVFKVDEHYSKIPAGWLIENAGLKGKSFGTISTYQNNAIVLVNDGTANREDIEKARDEIIEKVKAKFGITLETEPEFIQ